MKAFLVMFLFVASFAHAVEVKVTETPVDYFRPNAKSTFAINKEMGRAWVEVEIFDRAHGDRETASATLKVKVDGLVYDEASSSVLFTHEGQVFECASVTRRWYGTVIRPTGCDLRTRKVKLTYDDGYQTYKRDFHQVHLVTK